MRKPLSRICFLLSVLLLMSAGNLTAQNPDQIVRVSVTSDGKQVNSTSTSPAISSDGRWVAFESDAPNLVGGDTNGVYDIFLHDRENGHTSRVSVSSSGTQANRGSHRASISGDGRWVVFESAASNLVSGDTNNAADVFLRDRHSGTTTQVSVASDGTPANQFSGYASISSEGRYIAFQSYASNLVNGDANGTTDVFVHDRETGTTTRVSMTSDGSEANSYSGEPSISSDGRWVAFESGASNLVSGDTNAAPDIFVHDRETGTTTRVSIASNGAQSNNGSFAPSISADGTQVVFYSNASNLVAGDTNGVADVFVHDRQTGKTTRASLASNRAQSGGFSDAASISADGRWVVFASRAENLVSGDTNDSTDVFVHDRYTGETVRASVAANGAQAESYSNFPSISGNGRWIAFASPAKNLVAQDTNNALDVFVAAAPFIPIPNYFTLHPPAFSWNRIAGAPGYEFQIDRNPDFFSPVIHRDVHDLTFTLDVSLDSGIWYWRVRAAGGTWSSPERFVIAAP